MNGAAASAGIVFDEYSAYVSSLWSSHSVEELGKSQNIVFSDIIFFIVVKFK